MAHENLVIQVPGALVVALFVVLDRADTVVPNVRYVY